MHLFIPAVNHQEDALPSGSSPTGEEGQASGSQPGPSPQLPTPPVLPVAQAERPPPAPEAHASSLPTPEGEQGAPPDGPPGCESQPAEPSPTRRTARPTAGVTSRFDGWTSTQAIPPVTSPRRRGRPPAQSAAAAATQHSLADFFSVGGFMPHEKFPNFEERLPMLLQNPDLAKEVCIKLYEAYCSCYSVSCRAVEDVNELHAQGLAAFDRINELIIHQRSVADHIELLNRRRLGLHDRITGDMAGVQRGTDGVEGEQGRAGSEDRVKLQLWRLKGTGVFGEEAQIFRFDVVVGGKISNHIEVEAGAMYILRRSMISLLGTALSGRGQGVIEPTLKAKVRRGYCVVNMIIERFPNMALPSSFLRCRFQRGGLALDFSIYAMMSWRALASGLRPKVMHSKR